MKPIDKLTQRQRMILQIIDSRDGASAFYFADHFGIPAPSVRRDIRSLRAAGYDITLGVQRGCAGQKLYGWVKSPVSPQSVASHP